MHAVVALVNNGRVRSAGIEISVTRSYSALSEGQLCAGCSFFSRLCPVFIGEERTHACVFAVMKSETNDHWTWSGFYTGNGL